MDKWKLEKRALDLVCAIFYYGSFKAETPNEKELEKILIELGRWPTSEGVCIKNSEWFEDGCCPDKETDGTDRARTESNEANCTCSCHKEEWRRNELDKLEADEMYLSDF